LVFANLPADCRITITSPAGDVMDQFEHHADYQGGDIRWFQTFAGESAEDRVFSGGEHAWDLLTDQSQILARGLYFYAVQDLLTGELFTGQFTVLK
jgi:hypothetical protein